MVRGRDTSRVRIATPDMDFDEDGSVDASSSFNLCVYSGPTWSGFTKEARIITCSESPTDPSGNLVEQIRAGTIVKTGTITLEVDWDPGEETATASGIYGGPLNAAFRNRLEGDFTLTYPADDSETTGPVLTIPATFTGLKFIGEVLAEGEEARSAAEIILKLTGQVTYVAPT